MNKYADTEEVTQQMRGKWGIPCTDKDKRLSRYHPRLLNSGWLLEDLEIDDQEYDRAQNEIGQCISRFYPANNPAYWYVIADYVPQKLRKKVGEEAERATGDLAELEREVQKCFEDFLTQKKRMVASTHASLSRPLLDFSNQLVPYLTAQRYAGRSIYGGGDDVLAYTKFMGMGYSAVFQSR
ncbi:MAG: hypothetical protein ACK4QL_08575 [Pseudanabaenaceae cyanobacterium]